MASYFADVWRYKTSVCFPSAFTSDICKQEVVKEVINQCQQQLNIGPNVFTMNIMMLCDMGITGIGINWILTFIFWILVSQLVLYFKFLKNKLNWCCHLTQQVLGLWDLSQLEVDINLTETTDLPGLKVDPCNLWFSMLI